MLCTGWVYAQGENGSLKSAIETKQFVFEPRTVQPVSAIARQVSGQGYSLRLSTDSLVSHLPYFGRAYTAPMNSNGGLQFTSIQFDYAVKQRKRGGWEIALRPKDVSDVREFQVTVFENGSATLRALSNNRQPISFSGTVAATN